MRRQRNSSSPNCHNAHHKSVNARGICWLNNTGPSRTHDSILTSPSLIKIPSYILPNKSPWGTLYRGHIWFSNHTSVYLGAYHAYMEHSIVSHDRYTFPWWPPFQPLPNFIDPLFCSSYDPDDPRILTSVFIVSQLKCSSWNIVIKIRTNLSYYILSPSFIFSQFKIILNTLILKILFILFFIIYNLKGLDPEILSQ